MRNPKQLFDEIVKLAADALKSEEVNETEVVEETVVLAEEVQDVVEEQVVLAEEDEKEVVKEETPAAEPVAEIIAPVGVSKAEFDSAISEIKEMYTKVLESISPSQPQEVPEALSEVTEEAVELSEEVKPIKHNPEAKATQKKQVQFAKGKFNTTFDRVLNRLNK